MAAEKSENLSIKVGISLPYEYNKSGSGILSPSDAAACIPKRPINIRNVAILLTECIYLLRVIQTISVP